MFYQTDKLSKSGDQLGGWGESSGYCTVSYKILIKKLLMYGPHEQMVRWVENWLNGQAWGMMLSSLKSRGRPVNSNVHQGSLLHPLNSTSSLMMWMMEQSAPSISLPMTPNWEEQLIHERIVLSSRRMLTGWRSGLTPGGVESHDVQ